ncbi:hypothetical protein BKA59DRAFT_555136 [Fusarium tricinctum]|uniref:Integral membrane protein n=1 Tax=Fusarium tricinctum TaxID=61284 RepID=A0A8K0RZJ9_9HYPO|nr:hypothetical protein BKA59DRAFT_555136 [Fusarium tricinctum]
MTCIPQAFIFCAFLLGVVLAQDKNTTNNDNGDKMIGWVSPAPRRTTWSVIWSCMSIFIVCSCKCVHLNIPTHEEAKGEWHTLQVKFLPDISVWPKAPLRRKWRRKVLWMCFIALAPEIGVVLSVQQYVRARKDLKDANAKRSRERKQKSTMAYAFYVQMGGIVIYDVPGPFTSLQGQETTNERDALEVPQGTIITSLVKISEHEIKDLSKADIVTKAFAIIQCTRLTVQCIARSAQGYAISQLELGTLGFILCAFIMHIFWWSKPFDIETRRVLPRLPGSRTPSHLQLFLSMDDLTGNNPELSHERMLEVDDESGNFAFDIIESTAGLTQRLISGTFYLTAIGFSVIHLLAWNWKFPSPLIQQLWRLYSLGAAAVSMFPAAICAVCNVLDPQGTMVAGDDLSTFAATSIAIAGILYILLRLGVLVLTLYCLTSMPERAYTTMD